MGYFENTGSKATGVAEFIIGGAATSFFGYNSTVSFMNAADLLGNNGRINDVSNLATVAIAEFSSLAGSIAGNTITMIPRSWWIGEGYNHLAAGNISMVAAVLGGLVAYKGVGDFFRGVDDVGGSSRRGI